MRGEVERKFIWYGEPGGEQIVIKEISTKKHMVNFKVEGFTEDYDKEIKDLKTSIEFDIKKKQLVTMAYFEFKKIAELMKYKHYEKNRKNNFPFDRFKEFKKNATEYLF